MFRHHGIPKEARGVGCSMSSSTPPRRLERRVRRAGRRGIGISRSSRGRACPKATPTPATRRDRRPSWVRRAPSSESGLPLTWRVNLSIVVDQMRRSRRVAEACRRVVGEVEADGLWALTLFERCLELGLVAELRRQVVVPPDDVALGLATSAGRDHVPR